MSHHARLSHLNSGAQSAWCSRTCCGVVVEQAAAEPGHQHVGLGVAQLRHQRIGPLAQQVHGLLRGVGPRAQAVADQARPAACPCARADAWPACRGKGRWPRCRSSTAAPARRRRRRRRGNARAPAPCAPAAASTTTRCASAGTRLVPVACACRRRAARRVRGWRASRPSGARSPGGRHRPAPCACHRARSAPRGWSTAWSCPRRPSNWPRAPSSSRPPVTLEAAGYTARGRRARGCVLACVA